MTFTEAAVEILKLVGRPLHYKKITELAISRHMLSHVGKAPELTMSARLATIVKKDRGEEAVVKVRPGVFALRGFTKEMLALADSPDDIDWTQLGTPEPEAPRSVEISLDAVEEITPSVPSPHAALRSAAAALYTPEDDDDMPIMALLEAPTPPPTVVAEPGGEPKKEPRASQSGESENRHQHSRDRDRDRSEQNGSRRKKRGRDEASPRKEKVWKMAMDMSREPQEGDLLGKDLGDAVYAVMRESDMRPMSYLDLAELLVRRGRLSGDPKQLTSTVAAAIRADQARRSARQIDAFAPRFRHIDADVVLSEWYLPRDVVRQERDALKTIQRTREALHRAFLRKVQDLPPGGFAELMATWLNAEGVSTLRGVRRPGASSNELHLAGVLRRGPEETRLAITVIRDGREVTRERVVEMRGSLHHYGNATSAWIVTTGGVSRGAREEIAQGTISVALIDGGALAESMERLEIGLAPVQITLPAIDFGLLDLLRGRPDSPMRERDNNRERERPEGEVAVEEGAAEEGRTEARGEATGEAGADGRRKRRRKRRRRNGEEGPASGDGTSDEAAGGDEGAEASDDADDEDETSEVQGNLDEGGDIDETSDGLGERGNDPVSDSPDNGGASDSDIES